jgi:hypothetical protein
MIFVTSLNLLIGSTLLSGCSFNKSSNIPNIYVSEKGEKLFIHRVQYREENFKNISLWYTGSVFNEKSIRSLNPQFSRYIKKGDFVAIPSDLLLQTEQLPEDFLTGQKSNKSTTPVTQAKKTPSQIQQKKEKITATKPKIAVTEQSPKTAQSTQNRDNKKELAPQDTTIPLPSNETLEDELLKNLLSEE